MTETKQSQRIAELQKRLRKVLAIAKLLKRINRNKFAGVRYCYDPSHRN